ncbi:MAG TPA: hypothetical protein VN428_20735 [Bryobacteraceae bacterium]|nr:hypothetical protein [Bryobacteraceae bacterium]
MGTNVLQAHRIGDFWGWSLTGFLALLSLSLPGYLRLNADQNAQFITTAIALFFSGVIIGYLRPDRIWRWPLAAFLAFACWNVWTAARDPEFIVSDPSALLSVLSGNAAGDAMFAIPVFIGAAAGAVMLHGQE